MTYWAIVGNSSGQPPRFADDGFVAVPPEYAAHLVDVAGRFGVRPERLLAAIDLSPAMLERAQLELPKGAFFTLIERALTLTGEPGLGYSYGLSLKLSSHGPLGLLAMTSSTLREALHAAERFMQLRANELTLRIVEDGQQLALTFEHAVPSTLKLFFTEAFFVTLLSAGRTLTGRSLTGTVEMAFAEPPHFRRFSHLLPPDVRFGSSQNRLLFPREVLDLGVVTSDGVMARRVSRECEAELTALTDRMSFVARVRRELRAARGSLPSLEQAAERQRVSPRTFKRRLAAHGTTYRALVDELRRERAATLLSDGSHSVDQIAALLGYADKASFHRAFRRWFARTPDAYRRGARGEHDPS